MASKDYMQQLGCAAKAAAATVSAASAAQKNRALAATGEALLASRAQLMAENQKDLDAGRKKGLDEPLLDRLAFTEARVDAMVEGLQQVAALQDPVGEISELSTRPNGLQLGQMRVPLGVIGIIYESRPNVTIDAAALCLKAGNAVILRGGSEAIHSNLALAACIAKGLAAADLPAASVQVVASTDRALVGQLLALRDHVDVLVPRGGKSLIERVANEATMPVIKHLDGVCHVYVDAEADRQKALDISVNAKTQRYAVCNAMETLLVDQAQAAGLLPEIAARLSDQQVELRGCQATRALLGARHQVAEATEDDWRAEYLAPILAIRVVAGLDEAIAHINRYGSAHTDAIVTENYTRARRFLREVDSSSVLVNASTRFADGFEYGLGAEIGISTDKLHARGPVGLEGLTSQKFIVLGNGQIRE